MVEMSPHVPIYSGGPVGPKIVEAALNWLTPLLTMYSKKWPIKPIKVPFKKQSNGCTAYLKPIRHCTEVRLTSVQSTTMQYTLFFYNYEHTKKGHLLILLAKLARDS